MEHCDEKTMDSASFFNENDGCVCKKDFPTYRDGWTACTRDLGRVVLDLDFKAPLVIRPPHLWKE